MENKINIGELDTLITIQEALFTQGLQGNKKIEYVNHSRVWAKVERNISESISNDNLEEGNSLQVTCYKIPSLTTRWRIIVEGMPYDVIGIDPISRVSPLNILSLRAIN
jgi:head-tail adaptor